jgi:hypothetical protein
MKRILVTLLTAVGIGGPFVAPLLAQSNPLEADIPFAFVVSNRTMPAGKYRVSRLTTSAPVFTLNDGRGSGIIVMLPNREDGKPEAPSLTFACYGSEHVLAKITPPDSPTAYALTESSVEKNLSHRLSMASMISINLGSR